MSVQTSYTQEPDSAVEGMAAFGPGRFGDVIDSGVCSTRKLVSVAIVAANDAVYTITINGTPFVYTADGSALTTEIALGLKALINAGSEPVTASGVDTPLVLEADDSEDFTYSDGTSGGGSLTETVLVEAGQEVPFGRYVVQDDRALDDLGDADFAVRLPRLSTDITAGLAFGVVLEDRAHEENGAAFRADTLLPVMRKGKCWVKVDAACVVGDAVYVRYAAGGNGLGSFGVAAGSSERALLPNARYRTAAAINGLAILEIG